jgi:iron complex outermembrane recepter protein
MITRNSASALVLSFVCTQLYTASQANADIEHVLVTTPIHRSDAQTALPITVIAGDTLRDLATSNIGETLGNMPGLANASFGPSVGQPVIRGQQGPRVTVLQNGTGSADASNTSADHTVSVEPVLAESIEVLRGPATLLYGGGAIGGVINVIDHRIAEVIPEKLSGTAEIRHGSVNDEKTAVFKLTGAAGDLAFYLDGLKRESNFVQIPGLARVESHEQDDHHEEDEQTNTDGFIANSDSDMESFTLGGSYIFNSGFIGLAVNHLENNYGIPPGAHEGHEHESEPNQKEEPELEEENIRLNIKQTRYDMRGGIFSDEKTIETLRWALTYNDYQHDEIEGNGDIGTTFSNESWEARTELVHTAIAGFHGAVGLQIKNAEFSAVGDEAFIPQSHITRYGAFIVEDLHIDDVVYEFGLRLDHDRFNPKSTASDQHFNNLSVSSSALWNIDEHWKFGAALSSSERAPVIEELYSNNGNLQGAYIIHAASGVIELGNADLNNEQANNVDLSLSYQSAKADGFITVYYNNFDNYIYLENTGAEQNESAIFKYSQEDAAFTGIEMDVTLSLGSALGGEFDLRVFGDATKGELNNSGDAPRMPPSRIGNRLDYTRGPLSIYLSVLRAADQNDPGAFETQTEGYTRWDGGISYTFNEGASNALHTFLKLKNLSDEPIRSSVSFLRNNAPEAGKSMEAGVRYSF